MQKFRILCSIYAIIVLLTVNSISQEKEKVSLIPENDKSIETLHSINIDGNNIDYTTHTGTILLREEDGTPKGSFFYIAYTKNDEDDLSKRPLTFSFNGGPGSSSVWLHLGLLGPRRVLANDDGTAMPPPYKLVDNTYSLLDDTWFLLILFQLGTAGLFLVKIHSSSTDLSRMLNLMENSSDCMCQEIKDGHLQNF